MCNYSHLFRICTCSSCFFFHFFPHKNKSKVNLSRVGRVKQCLGKHLLDLPFDRSPIQMKLTTRRGLNTTWSGEVKKKLRDKIQNSDYVSVCQVIRSVESNIGKKFRQKLQKTYHSFGTSFKRDKTSSLSFAVLKLKQAIALSIIINIIIFMLWQFLEHHRACF